MRKLMKKLTIGLLLLLPFQLASSQDRIITVRHDTIFCRIASISPTSIQYEQQGPSMQRITKFIPTNQVLEHSRNSQSPEVNSYYWPGSSTFEPEYYWVIGVQVGGASLLASSANDENALVNRGIPKSQAKDYYKQLKHGWSFNGDIHYLFSDYVGLGAKYSFFMSSAQKDFTVKIDDYYPEYACMGMKEKQYIHYVGPSVIFQQWLDENRLIQLSEMLSAGYVHYRDELRMDPNQYIFPTLPASETARTNYNVLTKSDTWGATAGLSLEYYPASWFSIGVNAGFMYARLTQLDVSTVEATETVKLDQKDYQSLSRIDYLLNIRFHF